MSTDPIASEIEHLTTQLIDIATDFVAVVEKTDGRHESLIETIDTLSERLLGENTELEFGASRVTIPDSVLEMSRATTAIAKALDDGLAGSEIASAISSLEPLAGQIGEHAEAIRYGSDTIAAAINSVARQLERIADRMDEDTTRQATR